MILSSRTHSLSIVRRSPGIGIFGDVRQGQPWLSTGPHKRTEFERLFVKANPYHTTAGFLSQGTTDGNFTGSLRLKLYMPDNWPATHHHIIAVRVEFRPLDFYIGNSALPECADHVSDEYMLDDAFAKRRMYEVTIFSSHSTSRYRE
jgi:hypothetical protein